MNMMYLLFDKNGALKEKNITELVIQGSNNVNKIGVAIEDVDTSAYAIVGIATLPNGEKVASTPSTEIDEIFDGVNGVIFSLGQDMTVLAGMLKLNIQAIRLSDNKIITTYSVYLLVNEAVSDSDVVMLSVDQYESLVAIIERNVQPEDTILTIKTATLPTVSNYTVGQIVLQIYESGGTRIFKLYRASAESWIELYDFDVIKTFGRFVGNWMSMTTGGWFENLSQLISGGKPYYYQKGDYGIVQSGGNKIPSGSYIPGDATYETFPYTTATTISVSGDVVLYDGTQWKLYRWAYRIPKFSDLTGDPYSNDNLASALNELKDQKNFVKISQGLWYWHQDKSYCFESEDDLPSTIEDINSMFGTSFSSNGTYQVIVYMNLGEEGPAPYVNKYHKILYQFTKNGTTITWKKVHNIDPEYLYGYIKYSGTMTNLGATLFNYKGSNSVDKSADSQIEDYYVISPFNPTENFELLVPLTAEDYTIE